MTMHFTPPGASLYAWIVYDHPAEQPDKYVARRWELPPDDNAPAIPTPDEVVSSKLERLQAFMVEQGLKWMPRQDGDKPNILGLWV